MLKKANFLLIPFLFLYLISSGQEKDTTYVRLKKELIDASSVEEKVQSLFNLSNHTIEKNISESEDYLIQAEKIINTGKKIKNKEKLLADVYSKIGVIYYRRGNYSDAISLYLKAKQIYDAIDDIPNICELLHNIGVVYRFQGENEKAIRNFKEVIELNKQIKDTFRIAAAYNMMGVSYRRLKKLDSALICYDTAKTFFRRINRKNDVIRVDNNLSTLYAIQGRFDKSIPIKLRNVEYQKKAGEMMSLSILYYNLSRDYSRTGNNEKALKYADSSLTVAKKLGYKIRISRGFLRKSNVYKSMGRYQDAYQSYVNYKVYADSLYNVASIKRIQELELKYEFDKQKNELERLSKEQESQVKLYIFLFVLALVVGGVVGFLIYRNYTARVRIVKEKLEKEKLKEELLLEKVKVSESELKSLVADNSMRLQFITELSEQIKGDKKATDSKDIHQYTQALVLKLQQQITTENKLSAIQDRIEEVNRGFDKKIIETYPSLTKTEREVCALLRVNLSIKEIASIRNATTDCVKASRYRIRKKLQVPSGLELEHFIQSL